MKRPRRSRHLLPVAPFTLLLSLCLLGGLFLDEARGQALEFQWAKRAGGDLFDSGRAVAVDAAGNVFVTGSFATTSSFDDKELSVAGCIDVFLAKYDRSGNVQWVERAGGAFCDQVGYGVAVDSNGDVYITGEFAGEIDFSGTVLVSETDAVLTGATDLFVAKYSRDGEFLWVRQAGGVAPDNGILSSGYDQGNSIATDGENNVYVTGSFGYVDARQETDFGDGWSLTPVGQGDIFVAKYDAAGNVLWVRRAGGAGADVGADIVTDAAGNVFVTGFFRGAADFGDFTLSSGSPDFADVFVAKYSPTGGALWARAAGSSATDIATGIAVDPSGNVVIAGSFAGLGTPTAHFDHLSITAAGQKDGFVAKYDTLGRILWVKSGGGPEGDTGVDVAVNSDGDIFVTGEFTSSVDFDGVTVDPGPPGHYNYIATYASDGSILAARSVSAAPKSITVDGADDVLLTGGVGSADLDGIRLTTAGSSDILVAKMKTVYPPASADDCDEGGVGDTLTDPCLFLGRWEHELRCPAEVRRALGHDGDCSGVFEDGFAPSGAEEVWTLAIEDRTLEIGDADFYRIRVPDPGDPADDGKANIRPTTDPFRDDDPEPMPECASLTREDPDLGALDSTVNINVRGTLTIEIVPRRTERGSRRAVSLAGEELRVYLNGRPNPPEVSGPSYRKTIACPRGEITDTLKRLTFSFGERAGSRSEMATGGYDIRLEYKIVIDRGIPEWAFPEGGARRPGFLPCLSSPGISLGGGLGGGFGPVELFPACPDFGFGGAFLDLYHPIDSRFPDCIADGPGCWELISFRWPSSKEILDLTITSSSFLEVLILDVNQKVIAEGQHFDVFQKQLAQDDVQNLPQADPIDPNGEPTNDVKFAQQLVAKLQSGLYFLAITGPRTPYTLAFKPPQLVDQVSFLRSDANYDGKTDLSDGVRILLDLFAERRPKLCEKVSDANDDGEVNITDPIYLFAFLFGKGKEPPPPFEQCGFDPTPDKLTCVAPTSCGEF